MDLTAMSFPTALRCGALLLSALLFSLSAKAENLIPGDSSFESGMGELAVAGIEKGVWTLDGAQAFDGKQSLKLPGKGAWNRIYSRPLKIDLEPDSSITFSLYAKAAKDGVKMRLRVSDANLNSVTKVMDLADVGREWKRYSLTSPLKSGSYVLEIETQGSEFWVDAVQLEKGSQATPYVNNARNCVAVNIPMDNNRVFFKGERIPIGLAVYDGQGGGAGERKLAVRIADFKGKTVDVREFKAEPLDGRFKANFEFSPSALGWYGVTATLLVDGKPAGKGFASAAVVEPPVKIDAGHEPFCGICGDDTPGSRRIGGRWIETSIHWAWIEKEKGKLKLPDYSQIHAVGCKGKLFIVTTDSPKWAWDPVETEECEKMGIVLRRSLLVAKDKLDDWRAYIRALALHCKGKIDYIEVGAEDDLTFGTNPYYLKKYPECASAGMLVRGPAYERHIEMIAIACEEIRKAAPQIKIGVVRPSNCDCRNYAFSSPAIKLCSKYMDVFPIDCYTFPRFLGPGQSYTAVPEEFFPSSLGKAIEACRVNGSGQPIGVSEFGYAMDYRVAPDSEYVMEMIKRMTRAHLVARMTPKVEFLHWFHFSRCVEGGFYSYAIWRFGEILPTAPAYSAIAKIVENVDDAREIPLNGDAKCVVFRKEGRADAAVWMPHGGAKLACPALPDGTIMSDVMGNQFPSKADKSGNVFEIGEMPVYLSLDGERSFETLAGALAPSKVICEPVKTRFLTQRGDTATLFLRNQTGEDIEAKVSIKTGGSVMPERSEALKKDATVSMNVPLNAESGAVEVSIDCGKNYDKLSQSYGFSFEKCQAMKFSGEIDGDMAKWAGRPCIEMRERGQIQPPDPHISWKGPEQFSAKVYTGWDDNFLYLAVEVKDEVHSNTKSANISQGDCLQFAFDPLSDAGSFNSKQGEYGKDDVELGMALVNGRPQTVQWAGAGKLWKDSTYAIVRDEAAKKTVYEAKIPLLSLGMAPSEGAAFGFNFVIFNDDTGAGANYWYQLSPGIAGGGKNPALFKKFVLTK